MGYHMERKLVQRIFLISLILGLVCQQSVSLVLSIIRPQEKIIYSDDLIVIIERPSLTLSFLESLAIFWFASAIFFLALVIWFKWNAN